jgi:hypothetical protein
MEPNNGVFSDRDAAYVDPGENTFDCENVILA